MRNKYERSPCSISGFNIKREREGEGEGSKNKGVTRSLGDVKKRELKLFYFRRDRNYYEDKQTLKVELGYLNL